MERIIELSELLDWYGSLLTEKQRGIVSQYANEDCSLSEIAEREGISRQGVRDTLKRAEDQLRGYEKALRLAERFQKQERLAAAMRTLLKESALTDKQKDLLLLALDGIGAIWED